jgi:hypothetical protein
VLQTKLDQLNSLTLSQCQVQAMVDEFVSTIGKLRQSLRAGVPEEQRAALRQCVKLAFIDGRMDTVNVTIRDMPTGSSDSVPRPEESVCIRQRLLTRRPRHKLVYY